MSAPVFISSPRYTLTIAHRGRTRLVLGVALSAGELTVMLRAARATQRSHGAVLRLTSTAFRGAYRERFDGQVWRRQGAETTTAAEGREGVTT